MPDAVENFLEKAEAVVAPLAPAPLPADLPRVPFQTALKLTSDQEKRMIDHAFKRYAQLQNESGRDQTMNPQWWMNQSSNASLASQGLQTCDTFMGKRSRFDATFLNDVSWRPFTMGPDNIFRSSNLVVPLSRRICRQMIARAKNQFFGSDPWFSVKPAPVPEFDAVNDAARAQRIERFCRFKLDESDSSESLGRAIARALIVGECAVKTSYVVRDQVFNVEARVLHGVDGQPVKDAEGGFITEQDVFKDAEDGTGRRVLSRDGVTEEPDAPIWQVAPLTRRQVLFEGARSEPIFFKDFLCPLTATDVQSADTVVHLYDKPVMEFVDLVVKRGMAGGEPEQRILAAQKMIALVKNLADNSPAPKAAATQELRPNENYASAPNVETGGPIAEFAEFYMWYDANDDGIAENIMLICDRNTQAPIFYDHVANTTVDGLRPIEIVRVNPVENRWYGQGVIELFDSYQVITDLICNRWNFSQSRSGRVDFWSPENTLEGARDPNLKLNWGGTYSRRPGMKAEDCLEVVYLNDLKFDQVKIMMDLFLQLSVNESGVSNANDAQTAGLNSSDLATGIVDIRESGDELFKPLISDLKNSINRIVNREVGVVLANLNPVELYTYLEGDVQGIDQLTPDDVRGLRFKTKIELTTLKSNTDLQMSAQAIALVEKFYLLPPLVQEKVAPFYRQQLRILAPQSDPDTVIVPLPPMLTAPVGGEGGASQQLGEAGPAGGTQFPAQLTQAGNAKPE